MKSLSLQTLFLITLSIFISLILTLLPLPLWALWFKPPWVEMILFFWILYLPQHFNLTLAWGIGLIIDVLTNSPLGEHAATLIIASYFVKKFYQRLHMFPVWQQSLAISFILLLHQCLLFWIQHLLGQYPSWILWLPPLLSFFIWPLLITFLKQFSKQSLSFSSY